MRKIFVLLMAVILMFAAVSCNANELNEFELKKLAEEEIYPDFPGSLAVYYDSMEQLEEDADAVVQVQIQSQEVILLDGLPQTRSLAKVAVVLKGEMPQGSGIITVVEEGDRAAGVWMGVPPMEEGKEYILYLKEHEGDYYICGVFQGKFIIKEGYVFQQGAGYTKIDTYEPLKTEEFIEKYSE